jgi:undecaprenyl diphosphate synthase
MMLEVNDDPKSIPRHVAIIMDGNGRWAKSHHLPRLKGHQRGAESVEAVIETAMELGIEYITLYAFSVENWQRPHTEVQGLMQLLSSVLKQHREKLFKNKVRLRVIGRRKDLPEKIQKEIQECEDATRENRKLTLILALSYGSRVEIVEAVQKIGQKIQNGELRPEDVTEKTIQDNLYTVDIPDPDLLIRTSGEMRLSNFLLWQLSYTEIYITPVLWPDFSKIEFSKAVEEYQKRQRRFGGL